MDSYLNTIDVMLHTCELLLGDAIDALEEELPATHPEVALLAPHVRAAWENVIAALRVTGQPPFADPDELPADEDPRDD